jgi:hypothetical protein
MFARSVLLFSALFLLALGSAGDAEARRLRLFMGFSRATSAPKPEMPGPARTGAAPRAAPSSGAAPASRSGGVAIGSPVVAPLPSLSEERRGPDEAAAKAAVASQPALNSPGWSGPGCASVGAASEAWVSGLRAAAAASGQRRYGSKAWKMDWRLSSNRFSPSGGLSRRRMFQVKELAEGESAQSASINIRHGPEV